MINPIKKIIVFWLGCLLALSVEAQEKDSASEVRVEKFLAGVQVGWPLNWVYGELGLSDRVVLRGGLGMGFYGFVLNLGTQFRFVVALESRMYYNRAKRRRQAKDITGNSGNFLSIQLGYEPNQPGGKAFEEDVFIFSMLSAWGMRRNISHHFHYEAGAGVGYLYTVKTFSPIPLSVFYPHIYARIGYRF